MRIFVYKLGPRGLAQQLRDAQDEAVRALARSVNHEQVYGLGRLKLTVRLPSLQRTAIRRPVAKETSQTQ